MLGCSCASKSMVTMAGVENGPVRVTRMHGEKKRSARTDHARTRLAWMAQPRARCWTQHNQNMVESLYSSTKCCDYRRECYKCRRWHCAKRCWMGRNVWGVSQKLHFPLTSSHRPHPALYLSNQKVFDHARPIRTHRRVGSVAISRAISRKLRKNHHRKGAVEWKRAGLTRDYAPPPRMRRASSSSSARSLPVVAAASPPRFLPFLAGFAAG